VTGSSELILQVLIVVGLLLHNAVYDHNSLSIIHMVGVCNFVALLFIAVFLFWVWLWVIVPFCRAVVFMVLL
jgi:hypothetical protein